MVWSGKVLLAAVFVAVVALGFSVVARVHSMNDWVEVHVQLLAKERMALRETQELRRQLEQLTVEASAKLAVLHSTAHRQTAVTLKRSQRIPPANAQFRLENLQASKPDYAAVLSELDSHEEQLVDVLQKASVVVEQFPQKLHRIDAGWSRWFEKDNTPKFEPIALPPENQRPQ